MYKSKYNKNQILYIVEAMLEYFMTVLVLGSYLATLTTQLGFSDSLTGVLSAIISLGGLFQLGSMVIRRQKLKWFVIWFSILNQLLFATLYVVPFFGFSPAAKRVIFVIFIISAYLIYNVAHPKKISWFMSHVNDGIRGRFTANKEIVSLICGMGYTFLMGNIVDRFKAKGEIKTAFIICGATIFVLMIGHTLSMIFTDEISEEASSKNKKLWAQITDTLKNKDIQKISLLFIFWYVAKGIAEPFNAVYMVNDLGFSLTFISVLSIIQAIARVLFSRPLGRYADKYSFAKMLRICFIFAFLSFVVLVFAFPTNKGISIFSYNFTIGKIAFLLHFIAHGIALAGVNSALINLIFDYVPIETRSDSLALTQSLSGLMGFVSTFVAGFLVSYVQKSGNTFLGIPVYAQQLLNALSAVGVIGIMLFLQYCIINKKNK